MWPDPADNEANTEWVKDYYAATAPLSEAGGYINFMAGDDQDRIQDNYGANYDRLVEVKRDVRPGQPVPPEPEHRALTPSIPRGEEYRKRIQFSRERPRTHDAIHSHMCEPVMKLPFRVV